MHCSSLFNTVDFPFFSKVIFSFFFVLFMFEKNPDHSRVRVRVRVPVTPNGSLLTLYDHASHSFFLYTCEKLNRRLLLDPVDVMRPGFEGRGPRACVPRDPRREGPRHPSRLSRICRRVPGRPPSHGYRPPHLANCLLRFSPTSKCDPCWHL